MVMDTAPAAVLGATLDPQVAETLKGQTLVANVGNFHCLVFRLGPKGIEGIFEHHTGEVTREKLDNFITALADSTLQHQDVFDDMGHGALMFQPPSRLTEPFLAITGPRRGLLKASRLRPYFSIHQS